MGSRRDCTWVLALPGFRVENIEGADDSGTTRLRVHSERHGRRYPCSGCGRRISRVRSMKERTWDNLPWAAHPVTLIYPQRRVICRRCGIRTERIEFADAKARVTRRLRQQIGVDCQSMPTSHAAVSHGVSWGKLEHPNVLHGPWYRAPSDSIKVIRALPQCYQFEGRNEGRFPES